MPELDDPLGLVGHVIAEKYRVERAVGEGGFSVVYKAQHVLWKQPVALKFFTALSAAPDDMRDALCQSFIQEGALLSQLSSATPAIVQARDTGSYIAADGTWIPYVVLEWLEGRTLEEALEAERADGARSCTWRLAEVITLLGDVATALDVAHERGVAHRDIKPANFFVIGGDARQPGVSLKLLDFGVAKLMTANSQFRVALAKTGTVAPSFTPQYGAPEQYSRAFGPTGPWTDVFALALVTVELLRGEVAMAGDDVAQLAYTSTDRDVRPTPRTLGLEVPDAVEAVFAKALAVDPGQRYPRAAAFWLDLKSAVLNSTRVGISLPSPGPHEPAPPHSLSPSAVGRPRPPARRGASQSAVLVASLGLLLGAGYFYRSGLTGSVEDTTATVEPPVVRAAPAAPPTQIVEAVEPVCPDGMATIPQGQFFQGSDEKGVMANQKPAHAVTLSSYCIDLYEVTTEQYNACSDVGKCKRAATTVDWPNIKPKELAVYSKLCTRNAEGKGAHPINCVTWEMAQLYCEAQDKRLPTEAEWEYAARGPDGRLFPWGDDEPTNQHLNACGIECARWGQRHGIRLAGLYAEDDQYPTTAPVGQFEAGRSRFGLYDVVGNVWEWVGDWYANYKSQPQNNPKGPETGERRVIRGGGWNGSYSASLRPAFRYAQDPNATSHGIGFRCARSLGSVSRP